MCWKCDAVEVESPGPKIKGSPLDTWYWFGVLGLGFMVVSIVFFALGLGR
jgi:hypothetical protein